MPNYSNLIPSSEFTGAAVGVIGSGGSLGAQMVLTPPPGGATHTIEVLSLTTVTGQYIMRLKIDVTNSSGGDDYVSLSFGIPGGLASSTPHQIALWTKSIAFSGSSYFEWLGVNTYTAGGGFLSQSNNLGSPNGTWQRLTNSFVTDATATRAELYIGWGVPNGSSMSTTLEISQPMMVAGTWLPSYIKSALPQAVWSFGGHNRRYLHL